MAALASAESDRICNAITNQAAYPAPTTPLKLAVFSTLGSAGSAGTEATGGPGPYARQTITFTTAAGGTGLASNALVTFLGMPAGTWVAVEVYDNAGTPVRKLFGALGANKTTASGDTLSFASGAVTFTAV